MSASKRARTDTDPPEEELGCGSYGRVTACTFHGERCAMKQYMNPTAHAYTITSLLTETWIHLSAAEKPTGGVLECKAVRVEESATSKKPEIFVVMPLAQRGSLAKFVADNPRFFNSIDNMADLHDQLCQGYVEMRELMGSAVTCGHYDIKPDNILVFETADPGKFTYKFTDFSLATIGGHELDSKFSPYTLSYRSPEILAEEPYDGHSADMWAMGMTLLYAACGGPLVTRYTNVSVQFKVAALLSDSDYWPESVKFIPSRGLVPSGYLWEAPWYTLTLLERAWFLMGKPQEDMPAWFARKDSNGHFYRMLNMDPSKRRDHVRLLRDDPPVGFVPATWDPPTCGFPQFASKLVFWGLYDYRANKYAATWFLFLELVREFLGMDERPDIHEASGCLLLAALRLGDFSLFQDFGMQVKPKLLEFGLLGPCTTYKTIENIIRYQSRVHLNSPLMKMFGAVRQYKISSWLAATKKVVDVSTWFTLFDDVLKNE
jgi:serine/threonine protein kinase